MFIWCLFGAYLASSAAYLCLFDAYLASSAAYLVLIWCLFGLIWCLFGAYLGSFVTKTTSHDGPFNHKTLLYSYSEFLYGEQKRSRTDFYKAKL